MPRRRAVPEEPAAPATAPGVFRRQRNPVQRHHGRRHPGLPVPGLRQDLDAGCGPRPRLHVNDTFINANNLPNLIFLLVAGGVFNAVLVPQIIKASKAPDRGADYISRLLTLAVLLLLGLTALVTLAAPLVIDVTTQGY